MSNTTNLNTATNEQTLHEASGISAIGIDGGFLFAQVVNFFLLFLILRALVYKPILNALNERRKSIEDSLVLAEETTKKAQATSEEAIGIIAEARVEAKEIIDNAKVRAMAISEEIQQNAKTEVESLTVKTRDLLAKEKDVIIDQIHKEMATLLTKSLEKVLENKKIEFNTEELEQAIANTKGSR